MKSAAGLGSLPRFLAFNEREWIGIHLVLERRSMSYRACVRIRALGLIRNATAIAFSRVLNFGPRIGRVAANLGLVLVADCRG